MTTPISAEAAAWFAAAEQERLLVQRCTDCGHHQHYPRALCTACAGDALEFVESAGSGRVVSWTTVYRSPDPDRFVAPYTLAIVELDEGVRCLSRLDTTDPVCDARVTIAWDDIDGARLPVFVQEETD